MELYWRLLDKPQVALHLFILGNIVLAGNWHVGYLQVIYVVAAVGIVLSASWADFAKYRAAGLPVAVWQRHILITATIQCALAAAIFAWTGQWIGLAILALAWGYRMARPPQPRRDLAESLVGDSPGSESFGRYAVTPAAQLVYRPHNVTWMLTWLSVTLAGLFALGLSWWMGNEMKIVTIVWLLPIVVMIAYTANRMRDSLLDFLTFGGTRRAWARAVVKSSLVSVAISAVLTGLVWLWLGQFTPTLLIVGLLVPVLQTCAEFARNVWTALAFVLAMGCIPVVALADALPSLAPLVLTVGVYLAWVLVLPGWAYRAKVFEPSVGEFFGFKSQR